MHYQFINKTLEELPDPNKLYYISPILQSSGLTHLMKLVLCTAINKKAINIIKEIIKNEPEEINKQNTRGWTALMIACRNSYMESSIETIKLLLENPLTDANKQDKNGCTALMITFKYCSQELGKKIMDIFMNSKALSNKMNFYFSNKNGESIMDLILISNEFIEIIHNNRIWINNSIINRIIARDNMNIELLIPHIFNPLNFNYKILIEILKKHKNQKEIIYYCNLHTNIKKKALGKIKSQKEELYYKPCDIIALCSEVNFNLKLKNPTEVFNGLNEKLKYIFDIKNEEDMINKITFYL